MPIAWRSFASISIAPSKAHKATVRKWHKIFGRKSMGIRKLCRDSTSAKRRPHAALVEKPSPKCGYDDEFSPIVQRFHFSDSLRQSFEHADERQD